MTPLEATTLCRLAKAMCPQQAVDEYTPDAWHMLLEDARFVDAKEALVNLARRQPFVAPSEILTEVKRIRGQRIKDFGHFDVPPEITTSREYADFIRATNKRIADGEVASAAELETPGKSERHLPDTRELMASANASAKEVHANLRAALRGDQP
jgi:hypothetical protein